MAAILSRLWLISLLLTAWAIALGQDSGTVKDIVIRGNENVTQDAILAIMRTKPGQPYAQATLDADRTAISNMGFFSAVDVRAVPVENMQWEVIVQVSEFPRIKEFRVSGNTVVSTEKILASIVLKVGDVFNLNSLKPSADAIQKLYSDGGYFAQIEAFEPLAGSPGTINIQVLETRVNSVTIEGNRRTKPWVLERLIRTRPGDNFNRSKWIADLRRLVDTQWFDSLVPGDPNLVEPGRIDLSAKVTEARTGNFNVGIQLDPRSSLAGIIKVSESNLNGTGQSVGLNFVQATRGEGASVDLTYSNPVIDYRGSVLTAAVYNRLIFRFNDIGFGNSNDFEDNRYSERRAGASVGFTRPQSEELSFGASVRWENIKTNITGEVPDDLFVRQDGDVGVLTLGATRNRRDNNLDPARGDLLRLTIEPGYSDVQNVTTDGSEGTRYKGPFLRSTIEYRTYWSDQPPRLEDITAPRRVLAFRAKFGTIAGEVPFFEQFFVGGADTIRGYPEDRFWGKNMMLFSVEYRYPIQKAFSAIAFVDTGTAFGGYDSVGSYTQSATADFSVGYGVGLSFRTPLGPIRIDFGFDSQGRSRTHFQIGTSW